MLLKSLAACSWGLHNIQTQNYIEFKFNNKTPIKEWEKRVYRWKCFRCRGLTSLSLHTACGQVSYVEENTFITYLSLSSLFAISWHHLQDWRMDTASVCLDTVTIFTVISGKYWPSIERITAEWNTLHLSLHMYPYLLTYLLIWLVFHARLNKISLISYTRKTSIVVE